MFVSVFVCVGPVLFSPGFERRRRRCGSLIHQHIWTGGGLNILIEELVHTIYTDRQSTIGILEEVVVVVVSGRCV